MNNQPLSGARGVVTTLVRAWALILGLTLAAALGALAYCWWQDPEYKANATVYVTSGTSTTASAWDGVKASQDRVATYAKLIYSDAVLSPAIQSAGLSMPITQARDSIQVETDPLITTLTVSAVDHDPLVAQKLANAVSDSLADAVSTLDVPSGGGSPGARVTVINAAQVEADPIWPRPVITTAIAAGVGLLVGLVLALVLERLNNRVRDGKDAEVAFGSRSFATVPPTDGVIDFDKDNSASAKAFRALRTSFIAHTQESGARRVVVTSPRPGVEKTTVAVNLAEALAHAGNLVVAVDADLTDRVLSREAGVRNEPGLADVLSGRSSLDAVLMPTKSDRLAVIGAGSEASGTSTDLLASKEFGKLLNELANRFEYVIVDSGSILGSIDAVTTATSSDGLLVVARRKSKLSDLKEVRQQLEELNVKVVGLVYCDFAKAPKKTVEDDEPVIETRPRTADDEARRVRSGHRL